MGILRVNYIRVIVAMVVFMFMGIVSVSASDSDFALEEGTIYYLYSDTCPVCQRTAEYLDKIEEDHEFQRELIRLDVDDPGDLEIINRLLEKQGLSPTGVPFFVLEEGSITGFNDAVQAELDRLLLKEEERGEAGLISEERLSQLPLFMMTMIVGSVDGFNPCSIWALMFLLSMMVRFQSRKKMALVGTSFILTIGLVYGLFMMGLFMVVGSVLDHFWVRLLIFSLAFFIAWVNVSDGLGKKTIVDLRINDTYKKGFITRIREKLYGVENPFMLVGLSISIGLFASLIELPCTAGFPILWNSLLVEAGIEGMAYGGFLSLYVLMYILVEIIILVVFVWTMKKMFMSEKVGSHLKLGSGLLMGYLAVLLLMGERFINDVTFVLVGSLIIALVMVIRVWKSSN